MFTSWGRPCVLTTPLLSTFSAFSTPCQVECGWTLLAVLTRGGDVFVWWPLAGDFGQPSMDGVEEHDGVVACRPWETGASPGQIRPVAGPLPHLRGEDGEVGERIVKIAAGDGFLVGLTEGGHVLKADVRDGFSNPLRRPTWEYVSLHSW